jgi:hypothetical protein
MSTRIEIIQSSSPTRSTTTLMKTGQTTSYRTGDDGDLQAGRDTDFLTLDTAPLHNDGTATINTTTNRFTDVLGGQTYSDDIVLDWSTWNGSTILGYYRVISTGVAWNVAIDNSLLLSIGAFTSGWRLPNISEYTNIAKWSDTSRFFDYAPFNFGLNVFLWSSTTANSSSLNAFAMGFSTASTVILSQSKGNTSPRYISCRTFTLSTSNILS